MGFTLGWDTSQHFCEVRIASDFEVEVAEDLVDGFLVLVEAFVFLVHFLEGKAEVEGVVGLSRIKHQREFFAVFHEVEQFLMLFLEVGCGFCPIVYLLLVLCPQLVFQQRKRLAKIAGKGHKCHSCQKGEH